MTDMNTLQAALDAAPTLDEAALREITGAAGMAPMELVEMFVDDFNANLSVMQQALPANDRESFNRAAHSLKSSAGNVGAQRIALLAATIEKATKQELIPDAEALTKRLEAAFSDFCAFVDAHRVQLSVG